MYNFDKETNRFNTNSEKWDVLPNELPMWVADMDFEVAPSIVEALEKRVANKIYGYSGIPSYWAKAYQDFWKRRHNLDIEADELMYVTGIVPAISSIVRKLTAPAENVVVQTPVYNIFFNSIVNNGRNILESPLVYKNGEYSIDFDDLEEKLANPQTSLMLLCNPQNPVGHIWSVDELARIGELCRKHGVICVSDEIHCDITAPGKMYNPFLSASKENHECGVALIAPTKCFNIAGLHTAAILVPNKFIRHKIWRQINTDEVAEPNTFAIEGAVAALNGGEEWLEEMRKYVFDNRCFVEEYVKNNLSEYLYVVPGDSTYLLWIDCSRITNDSKEFTDFLRKETGLFVSNGVQYGGTGKHFFRLNVACPRSRVADGMNRLSEGIKKYLAK